MPLVSRPLHRLFPLADTLPRPYYSFTHTHPPGCALQDGLPSAPAPHLPRPMAPLAWTLQPPYYASTSSPLLGHRLPEGGEGAQGSATRLSHPARTPPLADTQDKLADSKSLQWHRLALPTLLGISVPEHDQHAEGCPVSTLQGPPLACNGTHQGVSWGDGVPVKALST